MLKIDFWPINIDLFCPSNQISYDWPGRSSKCWDIADFVHLILQSPLRNDDDLWTFIWPNDINVNITLSRYELLKIIGFRPEITPYWPLTSNPSKPHWQRLMLSHMTYSCQYHVLCKRRYILTCLRKYWYLPHWPWMTFDGFNGHWTFVG